MIKVSIIIPVCNTERYLKQCVESVIKQSLTDIEIICVNDGSKDNSLQILKDYAKEDSRIKVIDKPNSGYGDSVNKGIEVASGQYIGIVESDDFISEKMYETLYRLTDNGNVDVIKGNFWDYYDIGGKEPVEVTNTERKNMPDVEPSFTVRQYPQITWGHPSIWSGIYKREFLEKNNIKFIAAPGGGWVDNPFFFETLCLADSIKWTKEPFYYYRKTNMDSSSNNQSDLTLPIRRMLDNLDVLSRYSFNDEDILCFAYARAFMYLNGVVTQKHYYTQIDQVLPYVQEMMLKMNPEIINKRFNLKDRTTYYKYISPLKAARPESGKILIYNWVPFDNVGRVGGGVTVYCYNLISTILRERPDVKVYFLSSGWAYDASTTESYIRKTNNAFGERCYSFEIVNSPVPAAQDLLLNNPSCALESYELKNLFSAFLNDYGPFNVIHFNNIEGLSLDILDLKTEHPDTKFVYSIHNYVPFCVTGFYYQRHCKKNCSPNHSWEDCLACTDIGRSHGQGSRIYSRAIERVTDSKQIPESEWLSAFGFDELNEVKRPEALIEFCKNAADSINRNMDCMLAVSRRVYDIAAENGLDKSRMKVSYIGTKIAENQVKCSVAPKSDYLKVAHLGSNAYFGEKGFPFMMDALASLDEKYAKRIDLFLTTTNGNSDEIKKRLNHFHSVELKKGYTHDELKNMLKDVHLGIVPVLWEDNLPQIAIEMAALGVPVLSSSFGGASELCDSDLFRFEGGNIEDFNKHLIYLLENPSMLENYWQNHNGLMTMHRHWSELEEIFGVPRKTKIEMSLEQYALLMEENAFLYNHLGKGQQINDVSNSISYKVGRIITYIPRKIRGLIRCYKEHGMKYTIMRIGQHLSGNA